MAGTPHTHGNAPPHEHADDAPGHAHDAQGNVTGAASTTGTAAATGTGTAATGTGTAATTEHRHAGIGSHSHADARPGHSHDEDEEVSVRERPGGGMAGRVIFGLVGAAGMLVGPFFPWIDGERGTTVEIRAFFSTEAGSDAGFVASAGFVLLVLGAVALLGLLFRSGWLTSLAAGLGLAATVLVGVSELRGGEGLGGLGLGWWIAAIGSLLALIASMFATRTKVVETREPRTF